MTTNNCVNIKDLIVTVKNKVILDRVNVHVPKGTITAIVGESGSGKTTLVLSVLGLLASVMTMKATQLSVEGQSLLTPTAKELKRLRGSKVGFVFQEPLQAFDPLFTIGYQLEEVLEAHSDLNKDQRNKRIVEVLQLVGLPDTHAVIHRYPHQLSGGQRQRAMIALACVCYPSLLIADEPTSSLDSVMQQQILDTFKQLNKQLSMTMMMITHDLLVVKQIAHRVIVLKDGLIVEEGMVEDVLNHPKSEYTKQLIQASL